MLFSIFNVLRFFEALQMFFFKFLFTLSWRRPLLYRNQSTDLLRKSMDWLLCDNSLRHEQLKWGKDEEKCWVQHILWSSKISFCFWIEAYIFFQMVIFATSFRRCPTLWKSTLKMTTLFRRCLTLFSSTFKNKMLFPRCCTL